MAGSKSTLMAMLGALEEQIRKTMVTARALEQGKKPQSFGEYVSFRGRVEEMRSLSALIEMRLEDDFTFDTDTVKNQFERLDLAMLTILIRCNKNFFSVLLNRKGMPFGAREVLTAELSFLESTKERLARPVYADKVGESLVHDLNNVIEAVKAATDRAPDLADFTEEPSIEEWLAKQAENAPPPPKKKPWADG